MLHDVWFPPVGSEGDTGQPDLRPAAQKTVQAHYEESDFSNGGRMDSLEVRLDVSRILERRSRWSTCWWSVLTGRSRCAQDVHMDDSRGV